MVGLIQKVLLDLALKHGGPQAVARICQQAGIPEERRFRLDTVYSDEEWGRLLGAAVDVLEMPPEAVLDAYAEQFGRDALARWPVWFQMSRNAREFLERQPTIHNTFATGVRDAAERRGIRDKFRIEPREDELVMHYRSPNELCGLYKALARWVLAHYGETAEIEEPRCQKLGAPECEIHIRWAKSAGTPARPG
jgi:predicted hydrocarbon binding protein